jgi:N-acetylmuramoyl-L-alanine amidase
MMATAPDSPAASRIFPSPNHGESIGGAVPSMLLLHYTGMPDASGALARLVDPVAEVSCHYFVFEDGRVYQLVPEARRAWHAGRSAWDRVSDVNSHSIGVEIVNPGHEWGYRDFTPAQMESVSALAADIVRRWRIEPWRVLAHSDVAPDRKEDPGERFDWKRLAQRGAGLWTLPAPVRGGRFLSMGDRGQPVEALQAMFSLFGYGLAIDGIYGYATEAVVRAFQRHFRQDRVDGVADGSTIETLRDVVALKIGR